MADKACPSCKDDASAHHILKCLHRLCQTCFDDMQREYNGICPYCSEPTDESLFVVPTEQYDLNGMKTAIKRYNAMVKNIEDNKQQLEYLYKHVSEQLTEMASIIARAQILTDLTYLPPNILIELNAEKKRIELIRDDCKMYIERCGTIESTMLIAIINKKYDIDLTAQLTHIFERCHTFKQLTYDHRDFCSSDGKWITIFTRYKTIREIYIVNVTTKRKNTFKSYHNIKYSVKLKHSDRVHSAYYDPFTKDILYLKFDKDNKQYLCSARHNKYIVRVSNIMSNRIWIDYDNVKLFTNDNMIVHTYKKEYNFDTQVITLSNLEITES